MSIVFIAWGGGHPWLFNSGFPHHLRNMYVMQDACMSNKAHMFFTNMPKSTLNRKYNVRKHINLIIRIEFTPRLIKIGAG